MVVNSKLHFDVVLFVIMTNVAKDHIDIYLNNSRTYLMVFLYNVGIDLILRQII